MRCCSWNISYPMARDISLQPVRISYLWTRVANATNFLCICLPPRTSTKGMLFLRPMKMFGTALNTHALCVSFVFWSSHKSCESFINFHWTSAQQNGKNEVVRWKHENSLRDTRACRRCLVWAASKPQSLDQTTHIARHDHPLGRKLEKICYYVFRAILPVLMYTTCSALLLTASHDSPIKCKMHRRICKWFRKRPWPR